MAAAPVSRAPLSAPLPLPVAALLLLLDGRLRLRLRLAAPLLQHVVLCTQGTNI